MSYDVNSMNNGSRIISPEVELIKTEIDSLKLMGNTFLELGRALNEKSAKLEEVLGVLQRNAVKKMLSAMEELQKSENHGDMVSG